MKLSSRSIDYLAVSNVCGCCVLVFPILGNVLLRDRILNT